MALEAREINLKAIPKELKAFRQWVAWKIEIRDGKQTKVPVNPHTGGLAAVDKPQTWAFYEEALAAANNKGNAGIGFVFSEADPFAGIDIDDCIDQANEIHPMALEVTRTFNSFTEKSQSARGIHIIVRGKIPAGGRRKGKVEMYDKRRFFIMTGAHLEGTPITIESRQDELEAFHAQVFGQESATQPKPCRPATELDLSDEDLIVKAHGAANGAKFSRLWKGLWERDFPSQSEATAALLNYLVFYCGPDPGRIDRLFRASGLFRGKWDRPQSGSTWGALEIQKAIARATDFYNLGRRKERKAEMRRERAASFPEVKIIDHASPAWPKEVISGAAGTFARTFAEYLETPENFLFMNYLTLLGHIVSNSVTLKSEILPEPRLFLVNLGESADTRKTTSINKVNRFFQDALAEGVINGIWGVGSAEGLAKAFKKTGRVILILDEFKTLIQKMRIDASVLLPCICTLFEANRFHSLTKSHEIDITGGGLCLMAASTLDTYRNMFTSQFLDIGFINRLFIIIGESQRKFSIPQSIPGNVKHSLHQDLKEVLSFTKEISIDGRYAMPIASEAREIFDMWYFGLEQSVFSKRLDTYGHRLMPLLAINDMKDKITSEIVEKTIKLLNYQLAARKFADPIDADNAIARLEERIRRLLGVGPMRKRDLETSGHKNRVGSWIWNQAIKNLVSGQEVKVGQQGKSVIYWLDSE